MIWKTSRRDIPIERPLVMGILNATPDSFSDGGLYESFDEALQRGEQMIAEGVDIIDIGGESTRPQSAPVDPDLELKRTLPVVEALSKRFDTPISIDTTKWVVAEAAIDHGAEIINDISGLRWDRRIADIAARTSAGLVLMHSRGTFETMHSEPLVDDIFVEVTNSLKESVAIAKKWGVAEEQIALDIGIGFGKSQVQNLQLLADLGKIISEFEKYPMLVGASRKSFIGKLSPGAAAGPDRLGGSIAAALVAVQNGASMIRTHDVAATAQALRVATAIGQRKRDDEV